MLSSAPVGVFDSGVGGLSVMREIRELLPAENLVYVADSGHVPYGNKSPEFIAERCRRIARFLVSQGAKAIVIACNTATASGIKTLRQEFPQIPVVGMEPAVKPALAVTKTGIVGVLATVGTLQSAQFAGLLDKFAAATKVVTQPAPGLVECVENGDLRSSATRKLVASFVEPLLAKNVDVIVLGCTHYPFLRPLIAEIAGPGITLIDTGAAVARQLCRKLAAGALLNVPSPSVVTFYTSGGAQSATLTMSRLWGEECTVQKMLEV